MFKGLGNLTSLIKNAQQIGGRLQSLNDELKLQRVTGNAGGGMVEVEVNGLGQVLRISIEPDLIDRRDRELIEDLVPAAVNAAQAKAKELHAQAIKGFAGGIELPGLQEMLSKMQDFEPQQPGDEAEPR